MRVREVQKKGKIWEVSFFGDTPREKRILRDLFHRDGRVSASIHTPEDGSGTVFKGRTKTRCDCCTAAHERAFVNGD